MDALVSELSDDVYEVNVIEDRPISNRIASDLSVRHESPQLLIVEDGKAVFHTSHNSIRKDVILPEINP
jgi:bacillithiol system protein YtxJ